MGVYHMDKIGIKEESYFKNYETKLGKIQIIQEGEYIVGVYFLSNNTNKEKGKKEKETDLIKETYQQILEYLEGNRKEFTIPILLKGTTFRKKVWEALQTIPYGETRTYGEIAKQIGKEKASRAVGMANHDNPISILVPCHRVIGKNGKLVGYAGGLDNKAFLLQLEKERK